MKNLLSRIAKAIIITLCAAAISYVMWRTGTSGDRDTPLPQTEDGIQ